MTDYSAAPSALRANRNAQSQGSPSVRLTRPSLPKPQKQYQPCKFFGTPRGCYASTSCRFLHGLDSKEPPSEQTKTCRYFANGYCRHGKACWFKHETPTSSMSPLPDPTDSTGSTAEVAPSGEATFDSEESLACGICMDVPVQFGLLSGCSHIFCLDCLRNWRSPEGKAEDLLFSNITKTCPLCRIVSKFITPSSQYFPDGNPKKAAMIDAYKASMAKIPCKYLFRPGARKFCPYGNDCFYRHTDEQGQRYEFEHGVDVYMQIHKSRQFGLSRYRGFPSTNEGTSLRHFDGDVFSELPQTIAELAVALGELFRVDREEVEEYIRNEREAESDYSISLDEALPYGTEDDIIADFNFSSPSPERPLGASSDPPTPSTHNPHAARDVGFPGQHMEASGTSREINVGQDAGGSESPRMSPSAREENPSDVVVTRNPLVVPPSDANTLSPEHEATTTLRGHDVAAEGAASSHASSAVPSTLPLTRCQTSEGNVRSRHQGERAAVTRRRRSLDEAGCSWVQVQSNSRTVDSSGASADSPHHLGGVGDLDSEVRGNIPTPRPSSTAPSPTCSSWVSTEFLKVSNVSTPPWVDVDVSEATSSHTPSGSSSSVMHQPDGGNYHITFAV